MKKVFTQIFYLLCLIVLLVLPFFVFAATPTLEALTNVAESGGYAEGTGANSLSQFIGLAIYFFISILGIVFIVLMIYAGFKWMKASGREEEVNTAQDIIRRSIIGLIITISAYAITNFVLHGLLE